MRQVRQSEPGSIDPTAFDWAGDARRARGLQWLQIIVLLLFASAAVVAVMSVTRPIISGAQSQRANQSLADKMQLLRDEIAALESRFWRDLAEGRRSLPAGSKERIRFAPVVIRQLLAQDTSRDAGLVAAGADLLEVADEGANWIASAPQTIDPNTPEGRRWIGRSQEIFSRSLAVSEDWITQKRAQIASAARESEQSARRSVRWVGALLGGLALAVVVLGSWISQARSKLVVALGDAAGQLADRARTDQLSGLLNHASFHEQLHHDVVEARRTGQSLSLVLIDLDHFKQINDTYGHPVGDDVLVRFARLLSARCRTGDTVARVGGEEFAWIMPATSIDAAFEAAERLRMQVGSVPFGAVRRLTVSIGVCDLQDGRSSNDLVTLADGALYWAKAHGRNLTFRYSPDVVEELSAEERAARLEALSAVNTVRALAKAVDAKDPTTQRHSERVGQLAQAIAQRLGWSEPNAARLFEAALVHDVGKIGIPDTVLTKAGRLTPDEVQLVKAHPALGAQMVTGVLSDEQVAWIRGHHERYDGTGYPDGLAGDAISEGARILALADAWDAMTSARPYSTPVDVEAAIEECRRCSGTQFWSPAVDALCSLMAPQEVPAQAVSAGANV